MITQQDIIYFIVTDRFFNGNKQNDLAVDVTKPAECHGGDFEGLIKKIPYLKSLGVTAVWLTPVYLSIGSYGNGHGYHGYWVLDFEKVDPHLYTPVPDIPKDGRKYLKNLVDKLHKSKLKVVLDIIVNHTGYHTIAYEDYDGKKIEPQWFNPHGRAGETSSLAGLPDINLNIPDAADYFVGNIVDWLDETGIDAIHMDSAPPIHSTFWYYFKACVKGHCPTVTLIGDVPEPRTIHASAGYQQLHDFDSLCDFPLATALKDVFIYNHSLTTLARPRLHPDEPRGVLDIDTAVYTNANRLLTLLDNHDLDRRIKTEILDAVGHWDRRLANDIMKLCLAFLFTTRGIPLLYYGTEIGMEGGKDPDNRRDMRWEIFNGRYNPAAHDYEYFDAPEIFEYTKKLIKIRRENEALQYGYLFTLYVDHFVYAYLREFHGNLFIIVINNGLADMLFPVMIPVLANTNLPARIREAVRKKDLIDQLKGADYRLSFGELEVVLKRKSALILKLKA